MNKDIARHLLPLVNSDLFKLLQDYVNYRITYLSKQLESARDPILVRQYQGAIAEMRRFETLKDEIVGKSMHG